MDAPKRLLFTTIYAMRGVTARDLAASLGFDSKWVWKVILSFQRAGLVTLEGGIVKPAEWTLA